MRNIVYRACLILIFIIPWENFVVIPGIGTISRFSGFIVIALWIASLITTNEIRKLQPFHLVYVFYLLWQVISVFWSIDRDASWVRIGTSFQLLILMVMIWDVFRDNSSLVKGLQAYVLGGLVTAASVYYNYYERTFVTEFRTSAVGFNLNDASLILAIGIPFAWYLATQVEQRSPLLRWFNYLYLPVSVVAILLTGGRVSLVGTIPGFIFIFGTLKNVSPRWRILAFVSVIAITYFAQSLIPQDTVDRLITGTVAEVEDLDLNGRKEIWLRSLDEYLQAPLLGIGVGSGPTAVQAAIHNTLFAVILETGVMGLIILLWLTNKIFQEMSEQPSPLLKSLWANVLWIVLLANMLHSWQYRKQTWLALTFMLVSAHMLRAGVEQDEPAAIPIEPALQHVTGR